MPKFELSVRNASAVAANFRAADARLQREVRRVVREAGGLTRDLTAFFSPVDTHFLEEHARTVYSEGGYAFETGWDVLDFVEAGLEFYPIPQEEGWHDRAGRWHPGHHMLQRAYREVRPQFTADLSAALRRAVRREGR